ncbi:MAG: serine hydrolase [Deltaproteobacteria bacterium]|nr:MAG: serine hydrolase [Deltaproteobacteria bacterium]
MSILNKPIPLWGLFLGLVTAFAAGQVLGWAIFSPGGEARPEVRELREHHGQFTSPLLECEVFEDQGLKALKPFRYKVEALLQEKVAAGVLIDGSVYFRDLNNGMWFGINEGVAYRPASMLKVPVMIAWFKLAEDDPSLLKKTVTYTGAYELTEMQDVKPSARLVPGKRYAIDDLIYRMIALSDNNAAQLLVDNIDKRVLDEVLKDLDVNVNPADYEHMITAHAYAGFFRVLYNASYLGHAYSEKALEILAKSEFREGIRAGLPAGVPAATKFGEWGDSADSTIVQAHEFGIVYYPGRPYLLGVMTRGKRGKPFNDLLAEVSRLIYQSVEEQDRERSSPGR